MQWIDTHTHLYLEEFDQDRDQMMSRCITHDILKVLLPNIDTSSIPALCAMKDKYPNQSDLMLGLHPCSVRENYVSELDEIFTYLQKIEIVGIGEIGLDLYWDKSSIRRQIDAFKTQLRMAQDLKLPVSIHSREATSEAIQCIEDLGGNIKGVFHCFSGSKEQASSVVDLGMFLGIGGVVSYKKTNLPEIIELLGLSALVLETDSPYLPPIPYRGKRNESSYLPIIGAKIAEILTCSIEEVALYTTANARSIFYSTSEE